MVIALFPSSLPNQFLSGANHKALAQPTKTNTIFPLRQYFLGEDLAERKTLAGFLEWTEIEGRSSLSSQGIREQSLQITLLKIEVNEFAPERHKSFPDSP